MQIYKIDDVREFMAVLFLKENFDKFCVGTMEIKTLVSISVKGNLLTEWLTQEEKEVFGSREYVPWKLLRPLAFSLIKGEQTPQLLRIQFVHYMNNGDCGGLRIQYENNELHCISSYTPANFTLDKSSEHMCDDKCSEFFHKIRIVSTRL